MKLRPFHQARWNEPIIMEMSSEGERGILLPEVEPEIEAAVGDGVSQIPPALRRGRPPRLPELSQPHVLRHYLRLSQETLGTDVNIDLGQGTCTMKYSPKVHERLVRSPEVAELHPLQDEDTVQGILEVLHRFERMLCEISGMDRFSFQPGGGAHGIYANACIVRAYHEARGEAERRDEVITTIFSHPSDAACPATAGFKVITLYPGEKGYPELDALKAAVSERTAGLFITNPEDTGIYNPEIDRFVEVVHDAGGLCAYDQANANGILGVTRARDAGFDLCQFNIHKTFSSPHSSIGVGCGAAGVTEALARFLPVPTVEFDGDRYYLDWDRPDSIGKVRSFYGVPAVILRAYAWVLSLGAEGLLEVAHGAVLNNNYLAKKLADVPGLSISYAEGSPHPRLEQIRYSWQKLREDTGVGSADVSRRTADFGVTTFFTSHHPWLVPEPATLEPTETFSKADLDTYAAILAQIAMEAYSDPELVKTAPHNAPIHKIEPAPLDDPERWALTWRAYLRKKRTGAA